MFIVLYISKSFKLEYRDAFQNFPDNLKSLLWILIIAVYCIFKATRGYSRLLGCTECHQTPVISEFWIWFLSFLPSLSGYLVKPHSGNECLFSQSLGTLNLPSALLMSIKNALNLASSTYKQRLWAGMEKKYWVCDNYVTFQRFLKANFSL